MDQQTDSTWVTPILRLPTEIYLQIVDDLEELVHVAAFVSCCRTISTLLGRDFVHIRSAKEWRDGYYRGQSGITHTSLSSHQKIHLSVSRLPTLHLVIDTTQDKDVLAWVADIFIAHYPESITEYVHKDQLSMWHPPPKNYNYAPPLEFAVRCHNTSAIQILLERINKSEYFGFNVESSQHRLRRRYWRKSWDVLSDALEEKDRQHVLRILIDAGHYVFPDHIKYAVEINNPESESLDILLEGVQKQKPTWPISPYLDMAFAWCGDSLEDPRSEEDEDEAILREQHQNTMRNMMDRLIKAGVRIEERRYDFDGVESRPYRFLLQADEELYYTYPARAVFAEGWTKLALYLIKHQVHQNLNSPQHMRDLLEPIRSDYRDVTDWSYAPRRALIRGFHPELTAYLVDDDDDDDDDAPGQREGDQSPIHQDSERFRRGCEVLLAMFLEKLVPLQNLQHRKYAHLQEDLTYLLENGCSVSTDLIMEQIVHWQNISHFLLPGHRNPDTRKDSRPSRGNPACPECEAEDWDTPKLSFPAQERYTRSVVGQIDKYLSLAGPDSINGVWRQRIEDDVSELVIEMTPLSWALICGLWMVVYRLIHHGAKFSDLHIGAEAKIGKLYDETFPEGAAHPLVEKARQGRLKPDLRVFAEGVDGDPKAQALTLVMLTIGLPEADQPTTAQIVAHNKANAGKKRRGNQVDSSEETETQKTNGSRLLEVLIAENLLGEEVEYEDFMLTYVVEIHPRPPGKPPVPGPDEEYDGNDEYPTAMSFPVGYAVLQGIATTGSVRWIVEQVCNLYVADQSRPSGKPPQYHTTCFDFIKGFHPDFTRCLVDDEQCEGSDEEIEDHKWQLGCDLLMRLVLSSIVPSHAVVKYLLANGCRIPAAALAEEIQHWDESAHCLMRKYKDADVELCKKCVDSDAFAYQIRKKHTLRPRVSHLDALLSRANSFVLNDKVRLSDDPEAVDIKKVTLLSYAITRRLWIVAHRLIHHGADLSSLDEDAKASVRELYRKTFHGGSHPLVADARAGKFVPDTKVLTRGLKGNAEEQALTLVMLTIGLPSET